MSSMPNGLREPGAARLRPARRRFRRARMSHRSSRRRCAARRRAETRDRQRRAPRVPIRASVQRRAPGTRCVSAQPRAHIASASTAEIPATGKRQPVLSSQLFASDVTHRLPGRSAVPHGRRLDGELPPSVAGLQPKRATQRRRHVRYPARPLGRRQRVQKVHPVGIGRLVRRYQERRAGATVNRDGVQETRPQLFVSVAEQEVTLRNEDEPVRNGRDRRRIRDRP